MKKELNFPSNIDNLSKVEKLIDEVADAKKLSSEIYGNLLVATVEAVNNAILHGNKMDENKNVNVIFIVNETKLVITVKDQGDGFDYDNIPDPTAPENIEKPHGRGIFLMKNLVDDLEFKRNGKEVELIFNID